MTKVVCSCGLRVLIVKDVKGDLLMVIDGPTVEIVTEYGERVNGRQVHHCKRSRAGGS